MEPLRFDGRVAVVTGAGNGLGRAHALFLAARGAQVLVNDVGGNTTGQGHNTSPAEAVAQAIVETGGRAVANADSVLQGEKIIQSALDAFGRLDIIVNNAGILRDVTFAKMQPQDWDDVFAVHVTGAFRVTHAAWPHLRQQNYGRVIFTSSASGLYGNYGQTNYAAAKMALWGFSTSLALEGLSKNILVNTIAPIAASRMTESMLPPEVKEQLRPELVSPLVGWLAHETCTETGRLFEAGGGFFAQARVERASGASLGHDKISTPETLAERRADMGDFSRSSHPNNLLEAMREMMG